MGRTAVAKTRTDDLIAVLIAHLKPADSALRLTLTDHRVADRRIGGLRCDASGSWTTPSNIRSTDLGVLSTKAFTFGTVVAVAAYLPQFP